MNIGGPVLSIVTFGSYTGWVDSTAFESALQRAHPRHDAVLTGVHFRIPPGCKLMIVPTVRLLSLANQLCHLGKVVTIDFEHAGNEAMGYLNRVGFFDKLTQGVTVLPHRPMVSDAKAYFGNNAGVVEIAAIRKGAVDADLPSRLKEALRGACERPDADALAKSAGYIFAELIGNIEDHSESQIDGYAALQVYRGGNALQVTVSDSGEGIMETLRPVLQDQYTECAIMNDVELLVEVFRRGISRFGPDPVHGRGCGLKRCADQSLKYKAEMDVRLRKQWVRLVPGDGAYRPNMAYGLNEIPELRGTHISFKFDLG